MTSTTLRIGLLSPSAETRELLTAQVNALGLTRAEVAVEVEQYCAAYGDRPTRRLMEASPDIVLIDMQEPAATLQALEVLHAALPETWLFVSSRVNEASVIVDAMRAGAREYLGKPIPPRQLSQAVGRYLATRERSQQRKQAGQIHAVLGAKGGAGATSVSINLAAALADVVQEPAALIDLAGPLGDVAAYLNVKPEFTVTDALEAASRLDSVLLQSFMSRAGSLALLAGAREGAGAEAQGDAVARLLEVSAQTFPHSVLDVSAAIDRDQLRVIANVASTLLVVLTPELPSLWRARQLLALLLTVGGADKVRVVLNRNRAADMVPLEEIEKVLHRRLAWKVPNDYRRSMEAVHAGVPLVLPARSEVARSYVGLAHRVAGIASVPVPRRPLLAYLTPWTRPSNA
jgi:pilus assembly protein CpaE